MERTGAEPWVLFGDAMPERSPGTPSERSHGRRCSGLPGGSLEALGPADRRLDYPATGLLLFALGAWGLLRQAARRPRRSGCWCSPTGSPTTA